MFTILYIIQVTIEKGRWATLSRNSVVTIQVQKHIQPSLQDHKHAVTILRYLLSADTRDERLNWCSVISRAVANLRAWDPSSRKAVR